MSKFKLSTSPERTTITRIISSSTICRISWESDPSAIVNITNIGTNLSSRGYRDITIATNKTFIIDSINSTGLTNQRIINFIYQPISPTNNTSFLLYESGVAISLENNNQKMTLEG